MWECFEGVLCSRQCARILHVVSEPPLYNGNEATFLQCHFEERRNENTNLVLGCVVHAVVFKSSGIHSLHYLEKPL